MAKLLIATVLLALVAAACAKGCCNGADRKTVLRQWESVWRRNFNDNRIKISKDVFARYFDLYPAEKALFARVKGDQPDSAEWGAHTTRIIGALDQAINTLSNPEVLKSLTGHLSKQHVARVESGFSSAAFDRFEGALLDTLREVTSGFDANAWSACYRYIVNGLKSEF